MVQFIFHALAVDVIHDIGGPGGAFVRRLIKEKIIIIIIIIMVFAQLVTYINDVRSVSNIRPDFKLVDLQ